MSLLPNSLLIRLNLPSAIFVPVALSPLIITLSWAQWKAKKMGLIGSQQDENWVLAQDRPFGQKVKAFARSFPRKTKDFAEDLDVVGVSTTP